MPTDPAKPAAASPPPRVPTLDLEGRSARMAEVRRFEVRGRVTEIRGLLLKGAVAGVRVGEICEITDPAAGSRFGAEARCVPAEVVGFEAGEDALLLPLDRLDGIGTDSEIRPTGRRLRLPTGPELLGRVIDGLGRPLDGRPLETSGPAYPVDGPPPSPLSRTRITRPLATGVRVIDGLLTVGEGQRVGLFSGAGVGKSTLLGMIARHTDADVNVIALVGERGREVRDFIEGSLGPALPRSVVVVATSDQPAMVRLKCASVAVAAAESFRDAGQRVLLLMDSVSRFARAQREAGLAVGEPPARQGYTPSVFSAMPALLERLGNSAKGSITAFVTVLVTADDIRDDPVADEAMSLLDGHVMLSRRMAAAGRYPAVDVLRSVSRVMDEVASPEHRVSAARLRAMLSAQEEARDLLSVGAYRKGTNPVLDDALSRNDAISAFLRQPSGERTAFEETVKRLRALG
jgi:type III secretion protein N (ATPase)